jgi:hypothetical protein
MNRREPEHAMAAYDEAFEAPIPLDVAVFRAKCIDAAERYAIGKVRLLDAVDALQNYAVAYGLVADDISQDAVQAIMAEAFKRVQ